MQPNNIIGMSTSLKTKSMFWAKAEATLKDITQVFSLM